MLGGVLVRHRRGRDLHLDLVVEGDEAESISGVEPVHQCGQRRLCPVQPLPAIEPLLSRTTTRVRGDRSACGSGVGAVSSTSQRHLIVTLDGDDVQVQLGLDMHGFLRRRRTLRYALSRA